MKAAIPLAGVPQALIVEGWMNLENAAAYCDLHPERLRQFCQLNRVRFGRAGNRYRFKREDLDTFILGRRS